MNTSLRQCIEFVAFALLLALPVWAEETTPGNQPTVPISTLNEIPDVTVVVTDTAGTPHPASESISSVTVITAKEIEEQGAQTVADIMRLVPGVSLRQSGQMGASVSASIRGTGSKQMLVLIDGQRVSSQSFIGGVDLSKYPTEQIARIEVLRGPASSLYGSEAFGGVINIITNRPISTGYSTTLSQGSHGRSERSFTFRGAKESLLWTLSGSFPSFDGQRANSDFSAKELSGRLILPEIKGWEFDLRSDVYADGQGLPGATSYPSLTERQHFDRLNFDLSAKREVAEGDLMLRAYTISQVLNYDSPPYYSSRTTSRTDAAEMTYSREWARHQIVFGGEYRDDGNTSVASDTGTSRASVTNRALFVQDRYLATPRTNLVVGARLDDHSTAGGKITPRFGVNYALTQHTNLRTSFSRGFRAPNFVELYSNYPDFVYGYGTIGNPDLQPENSQQFEIGFSSAAGKTAFDIAVYQSRVSDLITYASYTGPAIPGINYTYKNINRASMRGVDLTLSHQVTSVANFDLSYSYVNAEDRATGERLIGIPHNKIALTASRAIASWNVALTGSWVDATPDFASSIVRSHSVFDLAFSRQGSSHLHPYVVVRNLLNNSYEEVVGYPAEGRGIELGLRSSW